MFEGYVIIIPNGIGMEQIPSCRRVTDILSVLIHTIAETW